MGKNWSYTIKEGEHAGVTLWSGCYCAVCAIIVHKVNNKLYFLVNKRGQGTPDYQGCWNLPCGFLDASESGVEACAREVYEECGVKIKNPDLFTLNSVETDPKTRNNGNVTLRYILYIEGDEYLNIVDDSDNDNGVHAEERGGEHDEVDAVKWVCEDDIDKYDWAFNHKDLIKKIINNIHY